MVEKDVNFYRNIAMKFIETNKTDLVKIYLQHSRTVPDEDKNAVLAFNMCEMDNNKLDVAFIPTRLLPIDMAEKVLDRQKENNENIIYFLLISPLEEQIMEIDIRDLTK